MRFIADGFHEYAEACYGNEGGMRGLPADQARQIEQAFLSGVHCALSFGNGCMATTESQQYIHNRLMEIGAFPVDGN